MYYMHKRTLTNTNIRIMGPIEVYAGGTRRTMSNELLKEMRGEDIIKAMKSKRISWFGHILRTNGGKYTKN